MYLPETEQSKSPKKSKQSPSETFCAPVNNQAKSEDLKGGFLCKNNRSGGQVKLQKEQIKCKKKTSGKSPINFSDIIKLAEQQKAGIPSQFEKDIATTKTRDLKNKKFVKLPDRPMTQEEKDRWNRVHSKEYQDWVKLGKSRPKFCVKDSKKKRKFEKETMAVNPQSTSDDLNDFSFEQVCDSQNQSISPNVISQKPVHHSDKNINNTEKYPTLPSKSVPNQSVASHSSSTINTQLYKKRKREIKNPSQRFVFFTLILNIVEWKF